MSRKVALAIKPTGIPHIGNWLGAIRPRGSELADRAGMRAAYFIADYHALTAVRRTAALRQMTYERRRDLARAARPDPNLDYRQSTSPEVFEL